MDEILYLESDEEITSVIDKVKKANSKSIGLVIPRSSGLIHSLVNLKLLKKEAEKSKKTISLVTADKIGKNIAAQVGLPVYEDVHAKKPLNQPDLTTLPKGDEVIEVDMSNGVDADETVSKNNKKTGDTETSGSPKVKYYAGAESSSSKDGAQKEARLDDDLSDTMTDRQQLVATNDTQLDQEQVMHLPADNDDDETLSRPVDTEDGDGDTNSPSNHQVSKATKEHAPAFTHHNFNDEEKTTYEPVRQSSGGANSMNRSMKGTVVFVGTLLLIIALSLGLLPQSTLVVTVAAESFEKTQPVVVDKEAKTTVVDSHTVPGRFIEINNDDAKRVPTTGKKDVGAKAKGTVTITNSWDGNDRKIASGTLFTYSDGKTFTLDTTTTIPGGTATLKEGQLVINPGKTTANLTASDPGDAGNIKPGRFTIAGLSPKETEKIYAENSSAFTGGSSKQVGVMTQSDIDSAKESLVADLAKAGLEQIKKEAKSDKFLDGSVVDQTISFETNPKTADSEADFFDIKVKTKHQAMVFNEKQTTDFVNSVIAKEVPSDKELLLGEGDEFTLTVDKPDYENGKLNLLCHLKTKIGTRIDPKSLKAKLVGKNEPSIKQELSTIPNFKDVTLAKFPSWWWQDTSFVPLNTRLKIVYE